MNDLLSVLVSAYKSGANPLPVLRQMAAQNPQAAQTLQMIQGKDIAQLQAMAQNMAKERGINLDNFVRQIGIRLDNFVRQIGIR